MTREKEIEILTLAGCTKKEAEKHLEKGTMVFDDFEKHFDTYMKDWCIEEDELPKYKRMIKEKVPVADWSIVEFEGKTYYIEYVL